MPIEIYYSSKKEKDLSKSTINYDQINSNTPYSGYSNLEQSTLYEQSTGGKSGKWYGTYFIQEDSTDNSYNKSYVFTLSLKEGILVFPGSSNNSFVQVGNVNYYTPTYQSGVYLKKNIEIIEEVVSGGNNDILYKYTIIY